MEIKILQNKKKKRRKNKGFRIRFWTSFLCSGVSAPPRRNPGAHYSMLTKKVKNTNVSNQFEAIKNQLIYVWYISGWKMLRWLQRAYGPTVGALNAESPKRTFSKISKKKGREISVFLTDSPYILHERSCNHFQKFPHTPMPPRHFKRPQN